jgi:hypothetical protein
VLGLEFRCGDGPQPAGGGGSGPNVPGVGDIKGAVLAVWMLCA